MVWNAVKKQNRGEVIEMLEFEKQLLASNRCLVSSMFMLFLQLGHKIAQQIQVALSQSCISPILKSPKLSKQICPKKSSNSKPQ